MALLLFGLTGGVASGKSTVAERFRAQGLAVIDADQIARDVVEPGSEGLQAVVAAFGPEVLGTEGSLDRGKLGALVFADPGARDRLNGIVHPRIRAATVERAQELEQRGTRLACYEAALLVESGLQDGFRPLVVVAVPEQVQLERLMLRNQLDETAARQRIAAQLPLGRKVAMADFVVDSSGTLEQTRERADTALEAIRRGLDVGRWQPGNFGAGIIG